MLHSIHSYPTVAAHLDRYERLGYRFAKALDMLTAYTQHIPPEEHQRCVCGATRPRGRVRVCGSLTGWPNPCPCATRAIGSIARLELFDELEEWQLIMQHYCLAWATTDAALAAGVQLASFGKSLAF